MVNRRNPAAGDPYPLSGVAVRSVIITGATGALGRAAARAPDRLHHGDQPVTACGGVKAARLAGRLSHRPGALPGRQQPRVAIICALVGPAPVFAGEPVGNRASRASAEVPGLLRRCVTGFGQTAVMMMTHDPVAAAHSRRDSRWPADRGRVPRRRTRVFARLPSTPARPFRIRGHYMNSLRSPSASPGSVPHRKARIC
jgi:hypothetical protein